MELIWQVIQAEFADVTDASEVTRILLRLLMAAVLGKVELFADSTAWNGFLWLVMNTCKVEGKPLYTGVELGALKASLPIVWR